MLTRGIVRNSAYGTVRDIHTLTQTFTRRGYKTTMEQEGDSSDDRGDLLLSDYRRERVAEKARI